MRNSDKTISANSKGIVIYYGENKKHMFASYLNTHIKKIQLEGTTRYQKLEEDFNPRQQELYGIITRGFSYYEEKELIRMPKSQRIKIKIDYSRAKTLLNRWKQEIINETVDGFFINMFPKSKTAKQFANCKGFDDSIECTISFRDLGISDYLVARKLVEFKLLPQNFFNLV